VALPTINPSDPRVQAIAAQRIADSNAAFDAALAPQLARQRQQQLEQARFNAELAAIAAGEHVVPTSSQDVVTSEPPPISAPAQSAPAPNTTAPGYILGDPTDAPSGAFNYGEEKTITSADSSYATDAGSPRKKKRRRKAKKPAKKPVAKKRTSAKARKAKVSKPRKKKRA